MAGATLYSYMHPLGRDRVSGRSLLTGRPAGSPPGACRANTSVSTSPQPLDLIGVLVVLNETRGQALLGRPYRRDVFDRLLKDPRLPVGLDLSEPEARRWQPPGGR